MRVLFGSFSAITVLGGGVEVQTRSLARELRTLGVTVDLFDPWQRYDLKQYDFFHLFGAHVGTYHLGRAVHSLGTRLVVTPVFYSRHSPRRIAAIVAAARQMRRCGGFWTEHLFCWELCRSSVAVLPNTRDELEMMVHGFGISRQQTVEIPNGVEERFYNADPEPFQQQFGMKDFVLYVGHIGWGRKNLLPLLRVLLRKKLPAVLIGPVVDTDYGRECLALAQTARHITVIPGLPIGSPLLASAYAACDTFVLPSLYETPGLAALEAGLAGAKLCITKYGGTREYFGDYAEYIEPRSEDSLSAALDRSLAKPKTSALRQHIHKHYLWSEAGKKLAETYQLFR